MEYTIIYQSVWTVVAFIIFVSIFLWAWSSRRKAEFDEIANVALDLPMGKSEKE